MSKPLQDILPPRCEEQLNIPESHIASFNYFLNKGLQLAVKDLQAVEVEFPEQNQYIRFWFESVKIGTPCLGNYDEKLYPSECRQMGRTYNAPCFAVISRQVNGKEIESEQRILCRLPIMVKSDKCHIKDATPEQLCKFGEEANEMGGYFICNGLEKLIRLLIVPRSNNPMAIKQPKNIQRGKLYSPYGIEIRCLRPDQTTNRNVVHYLTDGNCTVRFSLFRREYFIPVVVLLKAFINTTDREIYEKLTQGDETNTFLTDRVELLLREAKQFGVTSPAQALAFLGSRFRNMLRAPQRHSDKSVGESLIRQFILVHLTTGQAKFNYLIFLVRKLYAFVAGDITADNPDSQGNQDILLPGNLYLMIFKEQLQEYLNGVKLSMEIDKRRKLSADFLSQRYFQKCLKRALNIGQRLEHFLSTGTVTSNTGLDLLQKSGYTIIAEKLNYLRYLSHFRGVHRGQFFTTMKTTKVRKLLPEAWGFLCPVHTPDGGPCGLLNHLAAECKVVTDHESVDKLPTKLASLGMRPIQNAIVYPTDYVAVLLNAEIIGYIPPEIATSFVSQLRYLKVEGDPAVPEHLEIVNITPELRQFPAIYLFSTIGRMTRPVTYLKTGKREWIGSLEQVYMEIACVPDDVTKLTTHSEIGPMNMLSIVASLTPFSDFNQSPRNMYQCQMGKQTMATPCMALKQRVDNKMYRIQTPQIPLIRNDNQNNYRIDDYPMGTNALVAVISYTGYDMEDAMIINKSSYERGFGHGSVYKTETIDLRDKMSSGFEHFANPKKRLPSGEHILHEPTLDADGLPFVGQYLTKGDPYLCIHDSQLDKVIVKRYKSKEPCYIDSVTVVDVTVNGITRVNLKLRVPRNPIIGDKFSSRHGQKGVLSKLWAHIDMPFTESGMTPDIIINPHAFPSRMTIGMLIESMAGKSAALHGLKVNATPFRFDEKNTAIDHFGEQLVKAGYSYYGNEPMYSGISGTPMHADIFYGMVYYQRLRHMVSDKFQVRSTGPNNNLTRQPVKGRKMGGGIRLGEMERDSLLAHGASFMLHDRLLNCSDTHKAYVCSTCGSVISPLIRPLSSVNDSHKKVICTYCDTSTGIRLVNLPFVFRYLTNELAAMNIRVALHIEDASNRK